MKWNWINIDKLYEWKYSYSDKVAKLQRIMLILDYMHRVTKYEAKNLVPPRLSKKKEAETDGKSTKKKQLPTKFLKSVEYGFRFKTKVVI